jgi:CheY-like chemotaxis protein
MSKRILVVEDQPDNRQIIRDMLAPTDYEIAEVESRLRSKRTPLPTALVRQSVAQHPPPIFLAHFIGNARSG